MRDLLFKRQGGKMTIKILHYKTFSFVLLSFSHSAMVAFMCYLLACSLRHGNTYSTSADPHWYPRIPPVILCIWPTNNRIPLPVAARCLPQPWAWKTSPLLVALLSQSVVDRQPSGTYNIHAIMHLVLGWTGQKTLPQQFTHQIYHGVASPGKGGLPLCPASRWYEA